jgi:hypothetical protein
VSEAEVSAAAAARGAALEGSQTTMFFPIDVSGIHTLRPIRPPSARATRGRGSGRGRGRGGGDEDEDEQQAPSLSGIAIEVEGDGVRVRPILREEFESMISALSQPISLEEFMHRRERVV